MYIYIYTCRLKLSVRRVLFKFSLVQKFQTHLGKQMELLLLLPLVHHECFLASDLSKTKTMSHFIICLSSLRWLSLTMTSSFWVQTPVPSTGSSPSHQLTYFLDFLKGTCHFFLWLIIVHGQTWTWVVRVPVLSVQLFTLLTLDVLWSISICTYMYYYWELIYSTVCCKLIPKKCIFTDFKVSFPFIRIANTQPLNRSFNQSFWVVRLLFL